MLLAETRRGNIADHTWFDAIVHPCNTQLMFTTGVSGMLGIAGGAALVKDAASKGPIQLGEAIATPPGELRCAHVIHTAVMGHRLQDLEGPLRAGSLSSDDTMRRAMSNALATAEGLGAETIGVPVLSAGVAGFPTDVCARLMFETLYEYVEGNPTTRIRAVVMMVADPTQEQVFAAAHEALATREAEVQELQRRAAELAAQEQARAAEAAARAEAERVERERQEQLRLQRQHDEAARAKRDDRAFREASRERSDRAKAEQIRKMFVETEKLSPDEEQRARLAALAALPQEGADEMTDAGASSKDEFEGPPTVVRKRP